MKKIKKKKHHVYVLELEQNKVYVGSTCSLHRRLQEHRDADWRGLGAGFTKFYRPRFTHVGDVTTISCKTAEKARCVELTKTIQLMAKRGVENVRGGPYCQITLSDQTKAEIQRLIDHVKNRCFNCHASDHKRKECPIREEPAELPEVEGESPEMPEVEPEAESPVVTPHEVDLPGTVPMPRSDDTSPPVISTIVTTRSNTPRDDEHVDIRELPSKNKRRGIINRHRCCRIS